MDRIRNALWILEGVWTALQTAEWVWQHRQKFIGLAKRLRAFCLKVWHALRHMH